MKTSASIDVYKRLCEVIPGGVNSPIRACFAVQQTPLVAASAAGSFIIDVEGRRFIDYCMSWGALLHGHVHPEIMKALCQQMQHGTTYGTTSEIEERLARKVIDLMPSIERIRFVSSGTEATMSAVRLARGFTKRDLVVKFIGHYHGHADFFLVNAGSGVLHLNATSSSQGIPEDFIKHTLCLPFNDLESLHEVFGHSSLAGRIACVILEPIAGNIGVVPADPIFLKNVREWTERVGALLIFDEVITGFRVAKGGAQALYGITPDLTCLGKIVGGGLPAAAFGGRKEIMDLLAPLGPVYQAGTLSGNPLAMAAGLKALELLDQPDFYEDLQHTTDAFLHPLRTLIEEQEISACIQSVGSMFTFFFGKRAVRNAEDAKGCDRETFGRFFRHVFDHGIYFPPLQQEAAFISTAHSATQLETTQEVIAEFLTRS